MLCQNIVKATNSEPLPDVKSIHPSVCLWYAKEKFICCSNIALYLDNWEYLWYVMAHQDDQRIQLLEWLAEVRREKIPVLLSSRVCPEEYDVLIWNHPLPPLDRSAEEDKRLFQEIYQSKMDIFS